ncbi:hypothetical protein KCU78_g9551, partial [Aureobasidium melanogenum]
MSSQPDEINIPGLHAQILANLRITNPDIVQPVITTGCDNEGTWYAMFWNNEGKVVDCVGEFQSAVAALRGLLRCTSRDIYKKWLKDDSE